jgi:hypothetical protein
VTRTIVRTVKETTSLSYCIDIRHRAEECVIVEQNLGHFDRYSWSRPTARSVTVAVMLKMKKIKLTYSRLSIMFSVYRKVTHSARKYFRRGISMAVNVVVECWHLIVVSKSKAKRHSTILKHVMFLACRMEASESVRKPNSTRTKPLLLELAWCLVTLSGKWQSYKTYILCI